MTKRFRKAILCVAIGCVMAFAVALTGCSSDSTYEPESKTPQVQSPTIKENGVLRVGVNTGRAPLAGMSGNKIVGIDVDVAAAIADSLGLKLSIVDTGSDPEGALKDGSVDIVLGIDKSSSDGSFWKSDSYLPTGIALFAMSENAAVCDDWRQVRCAGFLHERLGGHERIRRHLAHFHLQPERGVRCLELGAGTICRC